MTQAREKALLRERIEQAELAQRELHAVKLENQASLRQMLDEEQHKARRLQLEIRDLHDSVEHVSEQQASAKVTGEKAYDDMRARQVPHVSYCLAGLSLTLSAENTCEHAST